MIESEIVFGGFLKGKIFQNMTAAGFPVNGGDVFHRFHEPAEVFRLDKKTGSVVNDDFRGRSEIAGDNRAASGHGLNENQAERFRPANRSQKSQGAAIKRRQVGTGDGAEIFDLVVEEGLNFGGEKGGGGRVGGAGDF